MTPRGYPREHLENWRGRGRPTAHVRRPPPPAGTGLLTPCWCESFADYPATVARGETWSCGAQRCHPPEGSEP